MLEEQNIIGHLFDVEREAAGLLSDAQDEYNRRIAVVREQAEVSFKEAYEQIIQKEEQRFEAAIKKLEEEKTVAFEQFCSELKGWKQDKLDLFKLLDSILFVAADTK